jgi:hypothetical protein
LRVRKFNGGGMKRTTLTVLIVAFLLGGTLWEPAVAGKEPQDVFDAVMTITVYGDGTGTVDVVTELKNPSYRSIILTANNSSEEFRKLVEQLVYTNLVEDMKSRREGFTIYVPPEGAVKVLGEWRAEVSFTVAPFVVQGKYGMECPYSGPLDFVAGGRVYSFLFRRVILILPRNATVVYTFPEPNQSADNVFIWDNATFLPMFAFRGPLGNNENKCTPLELNLSYSPAEAKVFFNASFLCNGTSPQFPGAKGVSYRRTGNLSIVSGYLVPKISYTEGLFKREWRAEIRLPFEFRKVKGASTVNGKSVEIRVTERGPLWLPFWVGASSALIGMITVGVRRWKHGKKGKP